MAVFLGLPAGFPPGPISGSVFLWRCFCRQEPPCNWRVPSLGNPLKAVAPKVTRGQNLGYRRLLRSRRSLLYLRDTQSEKVGSVAPPLFRWVSRTVGTVSSHKIDAFLDYVPEQPSAQHLLRVADFLRVRIFDFDIDRLVAKPRLNRPDSYYIGGSSKQSPRHPLPPWRQVGSLIGVGF